MKAILLSLLFLELSAQAAQLNLQRCSSVEHCRERIAQDRETLGVFLKQRAPRFMEVETDASGTTVYMTQDQAVGLCRDKYKDTPEGAHLPSARELARLAVSYGAKDIIEKGEKNRERSYYPVLTKSKLDNIVDDFYFSSDLSDYVKPKEELNLNLFWSSSFDPQNPIIGFTFFSSSYAVREPQLIGYLRTDDRAAVRCVIGR